MWQAPDEGVSGRTVLRKELQGGLHERVVHDDEFIGSSAASDLGLTQLQHHPHALLSRLDVASTEFQRLACVQDEIEGGEDHKNIAATSPLDAKPADAVKNGQCQWACSSRKPRLTHALSRLQATGSCRLEGGK